MTARSTPPQISPNQKAALWLCRILCVLWTLGAFAFAAAGHPGIGLALGLMAMALTAVSARAIRPAGDDWFVSVSIAAASIAIVLTFNDLVGLG